MHAHTQIQGSSHPRNRNGLSNSKHRWNHFRLTFVHRHNACICLCMAIVSINNHYYCTWPIYVDTIRKLQWNRLPSARVWCVSRFRSIIVLFWHYFHFITSPSDLSFYQRFHKTGNENSGNVARTCAWKRFPWSHLKDECVAFISLLVRAVERKQANNKQQHVWFGCLDSLAHALNIANMLLVYSVHCTGSMVTPVFQVWVSELFLDGIIFGAVRGPYVGNSKVVRMRATNAFTVRL